MTIYKKHHFLVKYTMAAIGQLFITRSGHTAYYYHFHHKLTAQNA